MRQTNRGFALIAAIILIVVAAAMAVVMTTLVSSSSQSGAKHISSAQALFIAEAGLERAIRQRSLDNTYVGEGPVAMGQGSYTITVFNTDFSGAALPSGQRRLRSVGQFDTATRTVEAIVRTGAAMMVYAKDSPAASRGVPYFRQWNNDTYAWGAEQQANDVGPIIRYMVLKFARTRNEAILGTMNSSGQIHVQVWNGTTWGAIRLLSNVTAANSAYRGFDIEYETSSDRAVVVFNNVNDRNPAYQVWDGTAWSATVSLSVPLGGNYTNNNNPPVWVDIATDPRATSNNIALFTLDTANGVYGAIWNGTTSTWSRPSGGTALWGTTSRNDRKPMAVEYEQLTGRVMFAWGTTTNGRQQYRIWNDATLNGPTNLDIAAMTTTADWVKLIAQPNSNNLMYVVQDNNRDLHTAFWNGAFAAATTHDTNTEAAASRNFDFVFETHPTRTGRGWLLWGTATGAADQVQPRHWNGAGWDALAAKIGDDTGYIRLVAHPGSGAVFASIYQTLNSATDDIQEVHLTGGGAAWSGAVVVWNGGTVANPVQHRIDLAAERRSPVISWREVFP